MPDHRPDATAGARVDVPIDQYLRDIARGVATDAVDTYRKLCPVPALEERLRRLENRFSLLIGFMIGSGFLGGLAGGWLATVLTSVTQSPHP